MITVSDVSLHFSEKPLFKDVNIKFTAGNCYGIIGANGAGKSTFLKILSGEQEHDTGEIFMTPGERMAVLSQDHFAFDSFSVKDTVMQGYPKLYEVSKARDEIYSKADFTEEDGIKSAELEAEFGELGGYEAENQIEQMLSGLGLEEKYHDKQMSELDESQKVRVLLAQALFGNPDVLLLDEPTNGLDLESIAWLEDFLIDFPNTVIVVSHDRHFLNAVCTYICDIDYGKITQFVTFPQKASISRSYYTSYNSNNTQAKYYSPDGKLSGTINVTGFPMIDEDRIFVFLPGGASFVKCTPDGQKEWEYGGTVPITAFDSSKSGVVIGFADGNICQFNTSGNLVQRFTPGGSDYNVILGAAISSSGEYIAVVSGQNRQRFVLAKRSENQTKITAHEFLNSNEPTQKLVKFSRDDSTVYFATSDDLGIVDVKTGKIRHIKLKGHANAIQESNESVFVLTKLEDTYTVYVIEKFATLTGAFSFSAKNAFILTDENRLYVGKDSTISCISISKK